MPLHIWSNFSVVQCAVVPWAKDAKIHEKFTMISNFAILRINHQFPHSHYIHHMKPSATLFTLFILLSVFSAQSQNDYNCKEILQTEPYTVRKHINFEDDSVKLDMSILVECGHMDSIDREIFTGPMLGQVMVMSASIFENADKMSFQKVLDAIDYFKKEHRTDYEKLRKATETRLQIQNLQVNLSELAEIRTTLIESGMPENKANEFEIFLRSHEQVWTYKEAMIAVIADDKAKSMQNETEPPVFNELTDLLSALSTAKAANKNCLIFFTCYACINAVKMEDRILSNPEIKSIIENDLSSFSAHVDDKRQKPNGAKETIGQAHMKLQLDFFKKSTQPYFVILSPDGKILATQEFTYSIEEFKSFLKKGLK